MLCSQNVLRELEQKKPQLDELVHTAENLKADSNRQQLHGKGRLVIPSPVTLFMFMLWIRSFTNVQLGGATFYSCFN
jgi:hypothetical protein